MNTLSPQASEYVAVWRRVLGGWLQWQEPRIQRFIVRWEEDLTAAESSSDSVMFFRESPIEYVRHLLLPPSLRNHPSTLEITLEDSIYVHHDFHRRKIGSQLLEALIEAARRIGIRSILANISADQAPSIRLHEKFGFQHVAHLRQVGTKFNQWFDAVYLQLSLAANPHGGANERQPFGADTNLMSAAAASRRSP